MARDELIELVRATTANLKARWTAGDQADADLVAMHYRAPNAEYMASGLIAAIEAQGFAIVPVEPTEAMITMGEIAWVNGAAEVFEAMLEAGQEQANG